MAIWAAFMAATLNLCNILHQTGTPRFLGPALDPCFTCSKFISSPLSPFSFGSVPYLFHVGLLLALSTQSLLCEHLSESQLPLALSVQLRIYATPVCGQLFYFPSIQLWICATPVSRSAMDFALYLTLQLQTFTRRVTIVLKFYAAKSCSRSVTGRAQAMYRSFATETDSTGCTPLLQGARYKRFRHEIVTPEGS
eukprot:5118874-Pleurochrysis_carterae.AAC.2